MSKGLNTTQIIGHLGRDPEMKYTASGAAVANFSVAVSESWKDGNGDKQERTTWFRCTAWNQLAEICNQYLLKGSKVYIQGKMQSRKYEDKDGIEREVWELVVNDMIMLDDKGGRQSRQQDEDEEPAPPPQRPAARPAPAQAAAPARQHAGPRNAPPPAPVRSRNQPQPVEDDDLPF